MRGHIVLACARFRRAVIWFRQVAAWVVLFAALAVLAVAVLIPRAAGATPYSVSSGSMSPALEPGDLIVVRPTERIGVGSVITFQIESGEPAIATHRVIAMTFRDGEPVFRTQGDANDTADGGWVRPVQVKGVLWYRAPHLGHLHSALSGSQRQLLVNSVAGGLLAYATLMFAGAIRDRRRGRRDAADSASAPTHGPESSRSSIADEVAL